MSAAELSMWDGPATMEHFADVRGVFHAAYPGRSLADHRDRLTRQAASSGFATVVARADRRVVGCVYGVPLQLGTLWWKDLSVPPGDEFTWEDGRRTFAVLELCVLPGPDGDLGERLVRTLLRRRREQRATTKSSAVVAAGSLLWRVPGAPPGSVPGPPQEGEIRVLRLPVR